MRYFFFHATATTVIYTLSLHDALPISARRFRGRAPEELPWTEKIEEPGVMDLIEVAQVTAKLDERSEEHTSELQSPVHLVCRLLLEKKKKKDYQSATSIYKLTCSSSIF